MHQPTDKTIDIPSKSFCCLKHVEQTSLFVACAPQCRMQWLNYLQILDTVNKFQLPKSKM